MAACEVVEANTEMDCLGLGSKEKWGDAFVFDMVLLEEGGPEYYVQFHKGEIDVTEDPVYRAALEKFAMIGEHINDDHSRSPGTRQSVW
jgi:hypothetical protein